MPTRYAICTKIGSSRLYWNNLTRRWTAFNFATQFSAAERKLTTLPPDAYWVSVLHGMGANSTYPAASELSSTPRERAAPSAAATHGTDSTAETAHVRRQTDRTAITNKGKKRSAK